MLHMAACPHCAVVSFLVSAEDRDTERDIITSSLLPPDVATDIIKRQKQCGSGVNESTSVYPQEARVTETPLKAVCW